MATASSTFSAYEFAGSSFIGTFTTSGLLKVKWILPNGQFVEFIDNGNGIPQDAINEALRLDPTYAAGITSVVAQWSQIALSLRTDLLEKRVEVTTVATTPRNEVAIAAPETAADYPNDFNSVSANNAIVSSPPITSQYSNTSANTNTASTSTPALQTTVNPATTPGTTAVRYFDPTIGEYTIDVPMAFAGNVATDPAANGTARGLSGAITTARASSTLADEAELDSTSDWRVKLSLAPDAGYLYKSTNPGILYPLYDTDGVVFPYTPQISVAYSSNYEPTDIVHSNYKIFNYKNSSVDNISLTCDFTAQDTYEANYLLAVIHFFRSVTKMFYGKDTSPKNGTPPPLCYLYGLGEYQFNAHPLLISSFTYNLPNDVDYIRASSALTPANSPSASVTPSPPSRLGSAISPGGIPTPVKWGSPTNNITSPTYVPTKMQITILAHPIITRAAISNRFSLAEYASGSLLRGSTRPTTSYGGIW